MTKIAEPIWIAGPINLADGALGTRQRYFLAIESGAEPPAPHLSLEVLVGRRHHPLVILAAGIHGDEYDGILALGELARELEPEKLNGTVVILPVANPYAFAAGERRTPDDDTDLNRAFPGRPDGSVSERLAHRLCQGLLRQADLVFTLHGAASSGYLSPWIEFLKEDTPVGNATFELARATGFPDLLGLDQLPGRLQRNMADLGVPVVEGEVGGRGATRPENVSYYQDRVLNLLRHARVIAGPSADLADQSIWGLGSLAAEADGIFLREVELRAAVREGDILGRIVDAQGALVSEVRATADCTVGGYRDHAGVRVGDALFNLWLPADQSRLGGRS